MSARIDTAAERFSLYDLHLSQGGGGYMEQNDTGDWVQYSSYRAALDEIDRLTAALAEAEDRGAAQMRERAAQAVIDAPDCSRLEAIFAICALPLREPGANTTTDFNQGENDAQ